MTRDGVRLVTLADFNVRNLDALFRNDPDPPRVEVVETPYGAVAPLLLDPDASCWRDHPDALLAWTRPGAVLPSFARALEWEAVDPEDLLRDVDAFASLLVAARDRVGLLLVPTWTLAPTDTWGGQLGFADGMGPANLLARANLHLAARLAEVPGCRVLEADPWLREAGTRGANPKHWYLSKTAFGNDVLKAAVRGVKSALLGSRGGSRKLVAVDLDDTLWGGVVGEVGWENVRLGGHDPEGEAFVDFQRALKSLTRRGVLLAIASKNEESVALEAIDRHPEMILRRDDFVDWRIDWQDKAANLADLVASLNLGLDAVVFLDDNPVERARVREALPEVLVPEWPEDKLLYRSALMQLTCFDTPVLSDEDRVRAASYRDERERDALKARVGSVDTWIASLETTVVIEDLGPATLARTTQLLNKTNQMNLTTRRLTDQELLAWAEAPGRGVWTFSVTDRIGTLGLVGILGLEGLQGGPARVVDFVLSCRAFGRKLEETMLALAVEVARDRGCRSVGAELRTTERNGPCLRFFRASGWEEKPEHRFAWETARSYAFPTAVRIEWQPPARSGEQPGPRDAVAS